MEKRVLTVAELIDFLALLPPGSEVLVAWSDAFVPVSAVTGLGFRIDRGSQPPLYTRRRATEEQTAELGAVLWIHPNQAPPASWLEQEMTAPHILDNEPEPQQPEPEPPLDSTRRSIPPDWTDS